MNDKVKNKLLGIIAESWCELDFYGFVVDCALIEESAFNYVKVLEEFERAVLTNPFNSSGMKYSKNLENNIRSVFTDHIMPMIRKEWDKVYGFVESHPEQYEHFLYNQGYDGYRSMMTDMMFDAFDGVMFPSLWGFEVEEDFDNE